MEKTFIAATGNAHKLVELRRILEPHGFKVEPATKEMLKGIVEDGTTFEENSLIKARHVHELTGLPTIADDSGISFDYLNGLPGIYSARFLGEDTPYSIINAQVLKILENVPLEKRGAHYTCVISIVTDKGEYTFDGIFEGHVGFTPKGTNGFGYDPIFCLSDGRSVAELPDGEKDKMSHRGKALEKLEENFSSIEF